MSKLLDILQTHNSDDVFVAKLVEDSFTLSKMGYASDNPMHDEDIIAAVNNLGYTDDEIKAAVMISAVNLTKWFEEQSTVDHREEMSGWVDNLTWINTAIIAWSIITVQIGDLTDWHLTMTERFMELHDDEWSESLAQILAIHGHFFYDVYPEELTADGP